MNRVRNRWRRFAFKCTLSVIGLALFTAQLSYKFYLCASRPVFNASVKAMPLKSQIGLHPFFPKYHSRDLPSLDKRYDLKQISELFAPPSLQEHLPLKQKKEFYLPTEAAISSAAFRVSLRGPPSV
jgi:hypothetical protein